MKVNSKLNKKPLPGSPGVPNWKMAEGETVMTLKGMFRTPLRSTLSRVKPGGMLRSQPPTDVQKSIVGAMRPSQVAPDVKPPD